MRNIQISVDEHYHIYNRGVSKQTIFHDKNDWVRFLFLILYFQSPTVFHNLGKYVKHYVKHSVFNTFKNAEKDVCEHRLVELVSFCIMPNHFHLVLKQIKEDGIPSYMQRVLNAYTKYYNTKYNKSGHLFQGPYQAVHIEDNEQLLYLSAYIHRNPIDMPAWKNKVSEYPWSSYQDYISKNRWNDLLLPKIVIEQFKNAKEYKKFIDTSTAKLIKEKLAL